MTGQSILNMMEVLNQELQLQTSEADQSRGLIALNMAQDSFEARASQIGRFKGDSTTTITTTANTETTAFPTGFLRIDRIQYLDPTTSRPSWDLENIKHVGGHSWNSFWPWNVVSTASSGHPRGYYTNGRSIYWTPLPSGTDTLRVYGFATATDITASGTFAYEDEVAFPLATIAVHILKIGVDDDPASVAGLSMMVLDEAIKSLRSTNRDGASPFNYTRTHDA